MEEKRIKPEFQLWRNYERTEFRECLSPARDPYFFNPTTKGA